MTVSAGRDSKTPKGQIAFYCEESTLSLYLRPSHSYPVSSLYRPISTRISLIIIQRFYTHCVYERVYRTPGGRD